MTIYNPNSILITGGSGFLGSNFKILLRSLYPNVTIINIDKIDYCSKEEKIDGKYIFYKDNINNSEILKIILLRYKIDTVIHIAAQTHVDNSFNNSIEFTKDNVLGTHNLIDCCYKYGKDIKRFIHISTDEVYGTVDNNHKGCNENAVLDPTNPYSASKAGAEFIVKSYNYSYKFPVIITRGNNIYGPRQYPEKIVPICIERLFLDNKIDIHGKGEARRNFIHVDDVSNAIITIMQKGEIGKIYNIGTNNEYSVMEIVSIIKNMIYPNKSIEEVVNYIDDRLFQDKRYAIDSTELRALGWSEKIPFNEGLKKTIEWYNNNREYFIA